MLVHQLKVTSLHSREWNADEYVIDIYDFTRNVHVAGPDLPFLEDHMQHQAITALMIGKIEIIHGYILNPEIPW